MNSSKPDWKSPHHGALLTIFLLLGVIGSCIFLFVVGHGLIKEPSEAYWEDSIGRLIMLVLGIVRLVMLIAVWRWRNWGAHGFFAASVVLLLLGGQVLNAQPPVGVFATVLHLVIFSFLIRAAWKPLRIYRRLGGIIAALFFMSLVIGSFGGSFLTVNENVKVADQNGQPTKRALVVFGDFGRYLHIKEDIRKPGYKDDLLKNEAYAKIRQLTDAKGEAQVIQRFPLNRHPIFYPPNILGPEWIFIVKDGYQDMLIPIDKSETRRYREILRGKIGLQVTMVKSYQIDNVV